jgi:hypothetical protein
MVAKRTSPTKTRKSESIVVTEESKMIDREVFDWGIRLTAHPFKGTEQQALFICSEIGNYKAGRGSEVSITFPAVSRQNPLRLLDAQTWGEAIDAIVAETRVMQAEMRTAASKKKKR